MNINDINCPLVNSGIYIGPDNIITACCANPTNGSKFVNTSQFYTDEKLNSIRKSLKDGTLFDNPLCISCKDDYKRKIVTHFERISQACESYPTVAPKYLDISFSNTCNYDCIMCSPYYSSKWEEFDNKNNFTFLKDNVFFRQQPTKSISYEQIDDIIMNWVPTLERIVIKGGEPFYDKKTFYFLEKTSKINPNLTLSFSTNGSVFNSDIAKILKRFKRIQPIVSCDGTGKVYEWVRGGSWETFYNNMLSFNELSQELTISYCVSAYNLFSMEETLDMFTEHNLRWQLLIAQNQYLNHSHIPEQIHTEIVTNIKRKHNISLPWFEQKAGDYNNFVNFTDIMNKRRGFNIQDYVPELTSILPKKNN